MANDDSRNLDSSKVDFSALVLGFSSAALHYLGHDAIEGKASSGVNLPLAMHNIEILALLAEKTQGNLSQEESRLINELLNDLRIKFVEAKRATER